MNGGASEVEDCDEMKFLIEFSHFELGIARIREIKD